MSATNPHYCTCGAPVGTVHRVGCILPSISGASTSSPRSGSVHREQCWPWISVEDRLPDDPDDVLGYFPCTPRHPYLACSHSGNGHWWSAEEGGSAGTPTHRMPLPEAPTK